MNFERWSEVLAEAFLDEGMTEYWCDRVMVETYADGVGSFLGRPLDVWHYERLSDAETAAAPPIGIRPSFVRGGLGSILSFYSRPALVLRTIENRHGRAVLDAIFAEYFARWSFRHPRFEDFVDIAREVGGDAVADLVPRPPSGLRTEERDQALISLGQELLACGYRFTTVTPATHQRVNQRPGNQVGTSLQAVFGWSRPFRRSSLPRTVVEKLDSLSITPHQPAACSSVKPELV